MADCSLFCQRLTTWPSPLIVALSAAAAMLKAVSFLLVPILVSIMSARSKNSVSVAPGIRQVTLTPLFFSSWRRANENDSRSALVPFHTAW